MEDFENQNTAVPNGPTAEQQADVDALMRKYDRESNTRYWKGLPAIIVKAVSAAFAIYCIYMTLFSTALPEVRLPLFMAFILILGFLTYPIRKGSPRINHIPWYDVVIMVLGAGAFIYFALSTTEWFCRLFPANILNSGKVQTIIQRVGNNRLFWGDIIIGFIGILAVAELCRRSVGIPILCVAGVFLIYTFVTLSMKPGATPYSVCNAVAKFLFYTTSGVIGTPLNVCYTYIVLFIIFGAFLERTGIANFFISFANRIAGWSSGGPAKVAVISSALCGMVSGSSVGNTVTTGSFTIPMMKKTGYKPEFAGSVEAAASTGGQIMPPIMGAAAFLMAEYMGIPYAQVAVKAILPAVLYFTGIFIAVHLEAQKLNLRGIPRDELPKWSYLGKNCYLILPLVLLVWLVSTGARTMQFSAAVSILAAFLIGFVNFFFTAKSGTYEEAPMKNGEAFEHAAKKSLFSGIDALEAGGKGGISVAVACGIAGIIAGCLTSTGLANILINGIVKLAGNFNIIGLVLTMLCCIVLGMGVPTTANYCIMAATCAPILIQLGIPKVAAHFFVFYFGIVADITPPVALAAYAGSAIAKANPMKTGINATKLAIAAFVVPYIFAYNPVMLFEGSFTAWEVILLCATALLGLFALAAALNGFLFRKIPWVFRILLIGGGLAMMIPGVLTDVIGLAVVGCIVVMQKLFTKKENAGAADM